MFRILGKSFKDGILPTTRSTLRFSTVKQAREARRAKILGKAPTESSSGISSTMIAILTLTTLSGAAAYDIHNNPNGTLGSQYYGSSFNKVVDSVYDSTFGKFNTIFKPAQDKLIPDWPTAPCYGNPPPGTPAPPLLVLDVERTLVGSVYDAKHGWRHVKRPGLQKFIKSLSQYYEIVLFSENDMGVAQDILMAIDPEGACHKLGAAAAEARGTVMLKRLDLMNRDLSKIILIDDSAESSQLFPRNTLQIKPFTNVGDTTDRALEDLIPLLHALVHDEVSDFRDTLDNLGTHDADEAVTEYKMRLSERKSTQEKKRNMGIGGIIRGRLNADLDDTSMGPRSTILSPSQIVGGLAPGTSSSSSSSFVPQGSKIEGSLRKDEKPSKPPAKKQGSLFKWLEETEKEKEATEMIKREKMNELYVQRMHEKAKREQSQQQQSAMEDDDDF